MFIQIIGALFCPEKVLKDIVMIILEIKMIKTYLTTTLLYVMLNELQSIGDCYVHL